jgi:hypothetical protein
MSGCLRRASENVARRISPFCTAQLAAAEGLASALIGGSRVSVAPALSDRVPDVHDPAVPPQDWRPDPGDKTVGDMIPWAGGMACKV